MTAELLLLPPTTGRGSADLAFVASPLFVRLTETLQRVARLLGECEAMRERATRPARDWGVPKLFFADPAAQAEWGDKQAESAAFPEPFVSLLAGVFPRLAQAWEQLPDRLDDAVALLGESLDVRRMARAVPGLRAAAQSVPQAAALAGILALPEEEVWLVIHPAERTGVRVVLEGAADLEQFQSLLAERGLWAGRRFQCYRPEALRPDGTLPVGLAGSSHWYWGREPLGDVHRVGGERVLLLGDPVLSAPAEPRFHTVKAGLTRLESMERGSVEAWLRERCLHYRPAIRSSARAA